MKGSVIFKSSISYRVNCGRGKGQSFMSPEVKIYDKKKLLNLPLAFIRIAPENGGDNICMFEFQKFTPRKKAHHVNTTRHRL